MKLFYSYDDGNLYTLTKECPLSVLMDEQCTENGMLIHACPETLEFVEYLGGVCTMFDTRVIKGKVIEHERITNQFMYDEYKPECTNNAYKIKNNDRLEFYQFVDQLIEAMKKC